MLEHMRGMLSTVAVAFLSAYIFLSAGTSVPDCPAMEKPVYLICQSGLRSYIASRILEGNGYETFNFSGGFRFYDAVVNDRALIERSYACGMDY